MFWKEPMPITVNIGEPMSFQVGCRRLQVPLGESAANRSVTVAQLARRVGLELSDDEGRLLIIVNHRLLPAGRVADHRLIDGDVVEFMTAATGG